MRCGTRGGSAQVRRRDGTLELARVHGAALFDEALAERAIHGVVPWPVRVWSALPIIGMLAIAATARFWGIGFGLPHPDCRPDEGAVAAVAGLLYYGHPLVGVYNYPPFFMIVIAA